MTIIGLLLVAIILGLLFLPGAWTQFILKRHNRTRDELPHTGQSLADFLIRRFQLDDVSLEVTRSGQDHYDPISRTVRLGENHWQTRSLTAMTVAAHEVGHALQHATGYQGLQRRLEMAILAQRIGQISGIALLAAPVLMLISKSPFLGMVIGALAALGFLMTVVVHLITLPVEFDASFDRALPILEDTRLLQGNDLHQAKRILTACALTYVAQSLLSILRLGRWLRFIRP